MDNKKVLGGILIIVFSCFIVFYSRLPENQDTDFYILTNEYFHLRVNSEFNVTNFFI